MRKQDIVEFSRNIQVIMKQMESEGGDIDALGINLTHAIAMRAKHLQTVTALEGDPHVHVHYSETRTGKSALVPVGIFSKPSFLSQPVLWVPENTHLETPIAEVEEKFETLAKNGVTSPALTTLSVIDFDDRPVPSFFDGKDEKTVLGRSAFERELIDAKSTTTPTTRKFADIIPGAVTRLLITTRDPTGALRLRGGDLFKYYLSSAQTNPPENNNVGANLLPMDTSSANSTVNKNLTTEKEVICRSLSITDRQDGTYEINFVTSIPLYLSISLRDQPIHGSPFAFGVKSGAFRFLTLPGGGQLDADGTVGRKRTPAVPGWNCNFASAAVGKAAGICTWTLQLVEINENNLRGDSSCTNASLLIGVAPASNGVRGDHPNLSSTLPGYYMPVASAPQPYVCTNFPGHRVTKPTSRGPVLQRDAIIEVILDFSRATVSFTYERVAQGTFSSLDTSVPLQLMVLMYDVPTSVRILSFQAVEVLYC
jgi:hypothetical protein